MACQGVKGLLKAFGAYYGFGIGGKFAIDVFEFFSTWLAVIILKGKGQIQWKDEYQLWDMGFES